MVTSAGLLSHTMIIMNLTLPFFFFFADGHMKSFKSLFLFLRYMQRLPEGVCSLHQVRDILTKFLMTNV